jgi:hypothetical protein
MSKCYNKYAERTPTERALEGKVTWESFLCIVRFVSDQEGNVRFGLMENKGGHLRSKAVWSVGKASYGNKNA